MPLTSSVALWWAAIFGGRAVGCGRATHNGLPTALKCLGCIGILWISCGYSYFQPCTCCDMDRDKRLFLLLVSLSLLAVAIGLGLRQQVYLKTGLILALAGLE